MKRDVFVWVRAKYAKAWDGNAWRLTVASKENDYSPQMAIYMDKSYAELKALSQICISVDQSTPPTHL